MQRHSLSGIFNCVAKTRSPLDSGGAVEQPAVRRVGGGSVGGSTGGWLRQRVGINGFLAVHSRGQVAHSPPGPRRAKRVSKASTAARLLLGAGPFAVGSPPGSGPAAPAAKRVKLSSLVDVTAEAELNPLTPRGRPRQV